MPETLYQLIVRRLKIEFSRNGTAKDQPVVADSKVLEGHFATVGIGNSEAEAVAALLGKVLYNYRKTATETVENPLEPGELLSLLQALRVEDESDLG